jgi:hypothetical protein
MSSFLMWKFCTEIKAPVAALNWLEEQLSDLASYCEVEEDEAAPFWCHYSREQPDVIEVWVEVHEEEDGDPFELSAAVAEMQKLFNLSEPWYITWAVVRDRPRIDGFRGGAAVCHKGEVTQIDTLDWALDLVRKLQGAGTEPPPDDATTFSH